MRRCFPLVDEDPTYEFPLAWYDERFMHYTSMEESPHANDVLDKLVKERYVLEFKDIDQAKRYLGGRTPVLNKMALITVMKDGALKHRLILDCRVSGANSNTRKYERVVIPRISDLLRDALKLKSKESPDK